MSKYIIELDENAKEVVVISLEDGDMWTETMEVEDLEQLNSDYINEHFGDLQDTAYQKGINDGSLDVKQRVEGAYQKGFEDGKTVHEKGCEGCEHECENKMTQTCILCCNAYKNRWIAKSDNIEVGDEVFDIPTKTKGILLEPETEHLLATVIIPSQRWRTFNASHVNLKKTGKHYDIEKLLEAMKV